MYVGVKQTVIDKIIKRLAEIRRENREPEYIALKAQEFAELKADYRLHTYTDCLSAKWLAFKDPVEPLTFHTHDFPLLASLDYRGYAPYKRYASSFKFMGVPVFCVEPEYMPA